MQKNILTQQQIDNLNKIPNLNKEIDKSKEDYFGKEHNTLKDRLDSDFDTTYISGIKHSFIEKTITDNTCIEATIEGKSKDLVIKGETLQNLLSENKTISSTPNRDSFLTNKLSVDWIVNKKYTVIFKLDKVGIGDISFRSDNNISDFSSKQNFSSGQNKILFTPTKTPSTNPVLVIALRDNTDVIITISDSMVLEGDWTNKNVPEHFENIKSVGEEDNNKIKLLSFSGFNLINYHLGKNVGGISSNGELSTSGEFTNLDSTFKHFTPVCLNETYSYFIKSLDSNNKPMPFWGEISGYDENFNFVKRILRSSTSPKIFNIDDNRIKYIRAGVRGTFKPTLVKGDISNSQPNTILVDGLYEYRVENKTEILLPIKNGLKSVGDIKDKIDYVNGNIIENIGRIVLNGSENWSKINPDDRSSAFECRDFRDKFLKFNSESFIFDKIPNSDECYIINTKDGWHIDSEKDIWIRIDNTLLDEVSANGFKKKLRENPITIYYQLANPIIHKINEFVNLKTYNDKTYINLENKIKPTLTCKVPINTPVYIANIEKENENIRKYNEEINNLLDDNINSLTAMDQTLISNDLELDFRLFEVEMKFNTTR